MDLEALLKRHVPAPLTSAQKRNGMITTAGIVAKIIHEGRLLGARSTEERTLNRVSKALTRHGFTGREAVPPQEFSPEQRAALRALVVASVLSNTA